MFRRAVIVFTSLALLTSSVSEAAAAPPGAAPLISAEDSVIAVPRQPASPRVEAQRAGTGLAPAQAFRTTWPQAGEATVDVPGDRQASARAGQTAVSVAQPATVPAGKRAAQRVKVTAFDSPVARRLGGHGTAFRLAGDDTVGVKVDVSGFAGAFGGDFESRLRLVAKPACALERPEAPECRTSRQVGSHVDLASHTLVADVPAAADTVYVVVAAANGETGSYTATKLASSSKWQVNLQSGDFSWSYPLPVVPAVAGKAPDMSLGYSSQAVDGLTASENAQPSWVGLGWDLATPFIERRYNGCADDGGDTGDLCWAGDQLMLSLEGTSSELVRDKSVTGDVWRAKQDPGWRVERRRDGAGNGDNDGEYWIVTDTRGTRFTFGRGVQPKTGAQTRSVFHVPVFGDDSGEPCHQGSVSDSWCEQAWRWNLDNVVDAHGNSTTYFYEPETNKYARNGDADKSTSYVRGGHVRDIVYSQRAGGEDVTAPARLHFTHQLRCIEAAGGSGTCPAFDADHASSYPDVPLDQLCTDRCTGDEQKSPTFFTGELLRSVSAQRADGQSYVDVDRVDFSYSFPKPSDGTSASLWLERFQQTGLGGTAELALPPVVFSGEERANRVDFNTSAGVPELKKLRLASATDELGRRVEVGYGQPHACSRDNFPEGRADTNTQDCFPAWRANDQSSGFGWWHKYLTTKVTVIDRAGGSGNQVTEYRYRGDPAWHYDDDDVTPTARKTWSDWRGYGSVDVAKMSGARTVSLTRNLFFRGMNGDRKADGSTKSVTVTDSQGTALTDTPWLRGKQRETQQFDVDGAGTVGPELGGELHTYISAHTTPFEPGKVNNDDDANMVVQSTGITRVAVIAEPGGQRSTRTNRLDNTYDAHGQVTQVLDTTDGGNDPKCTKTSYARDTATIDRGLIALPYRTRTYAGTCSALTALISGKDTFYDGSGTLGAAITRGDPTKVVDAVEATGTDNVTATVTTSATFDDHGRTITETDGNGNTARTTFTPAVGRPASVTETNPLGHTETTVFDADRQQPATVTDVNGQVTTNGYDPLGRLTSVRLPGQGANAPPAKVFEYFLDPQQAKAPKITTKQLQSGSHYLLSWSFLDSLGRDRQTQEISPASTPDAPKTIVTDTRYDDTGHVAANSLPVVTSGAAGTELLAVPADAVIETRHAYDTTGRETRTAHVAKGRELWAATTAYFGDHIRSTPPAGGVPTVSWSDQRNRLVRKVEGTGNTTATTSYTYNPAGRLETITDSAAHRSTFTYDLLGRRVELSDMDSGRSRTRYDANGNVLASWDAKATTTPTVSTDYDKLNRPIARWAGASGTGTKTATWTYDTAPLGVGKTAAETTITGGKNYTQAHLGYDQRGRVTGRSWTFPGGLGGLLADTTYRTNYSYDEADHETSISYQDGVIGAPKETVTTEYNQLGDPSRLTGAITDPLTGHVSTHNYVAATGYASDGKLGSRDYANPLFPLRRAYSYEPDTQRLSQLQTQVTDPVVGQTHTKQDDRYRWDPAGNIKAITDQTLGDPVATCYDYDQLARLSHAWTTKRTDCSDASATMTADGPAGFNQSWTYSPDGNITSARSLGTTKQYSYGDQAHPHAATKVGNQTYEYDQNGALKRKPGLLVLDQRYEFNAEHQLESVTKNLVEKTSFVYAPDGTRLARIDPLGATLYIDGQEIKSLLGVLPTAQRFYEHAGTTVAVRHGEGLGLLVWQLNDTQGSAQIQLAAGTPAPLRTYYSPFGEIRQLSAPPLTDRGWLGRPKDPTTGLSALGARYYDSDIARFISTDPANDLSSAQTANPYSYGANNPITFTDPQGLWSLSGAWNWVKDKANKAADWVSENKGLITNVVVGIGVAVAVGAVCATGVGCVILAGAAAGAAGAAAGYGVDVAEGKKDFSWGGLAKETAFGAATGAAFAGAGAAVGKVAGAAAGAIGRTSAGQAVKAAASTAGKHIANTARAAGDKVASGVSKVASAAKSAAKSVTSSVKSGGGKGSPAAETGETYFRTMSKAHFETLKTTGRVPATKETFISPTQKFSEAYEGVLVEMTVKAGTTDALIAVGVRDASAITTSRFPWMPLVSKGWTKTSAFFKGEGTQVNIGLGRGKALDIFNDAMTGWREIPR